MGESSKILKIIDDRIEKKIKKSKMVTKHIGTIVASPENISKEIKTQVDMGKEVFVQIAGYDDIFNFINKTGYKLNVGDSVQIECPFGTMTSGYISEKLGKENILYQGKNIFFKKVPPSEKEESGNEGDLWICYNDGT